MFDVILKGTEILNQVDGLNNKIKSCSGDELLYLRDILRDILQGKDQEKLNDDFILIAHLYTVFNKIGGKKYAKLQEVVTNLGTKLGKDLEELKDKNIIKCLNSNSMPYWKYDAKNGLHYREHNKLTYYATELNSRTSETTFYKEKSK